MAVIGWNASFYGNIAHLAPTLYFAAKVIVPIGLAARRQ